MKISLCSYNNGQNKTSLWRQSGHSIYSMKTSDIPPWQNATLPHLHFSLSGIKGEFSLQHSEGTFKKSPAPCQSLLKCDLTYETTMWVTAILLSGSSISVIKKKKKKNPTHFFFQKINKQYTKWSFNLMLMDENTEKKRKPQTQKATVAQLSLVQNDKWQRTQKHRNEWHFTRAYWFSIKPFTPFCLEYK